MLKRIHKILQFLFSFNACFWKTPSVSVKIASHESNDSTYAN